MTMAKQLARRLEEVFINGTWIAHTNYTAQISDIDWQKATQKVGSLNTIVQLTFHITFYLEGLNQVFDGGPLDIRDQFSFDMKPVTNQEDWIQLKNHFSTNAHAFIQYVASMSDEQLQHSFVDKKYGTYQRNIEGVIEHSYYHLGQVSLIKKMIDAS